MLRDFAALPEHPVTVDADGVALEGDLTIPAGAHGLVIFAHGSGSSRHSPRNRHVAQILLEARLGTLLFDLLTAEEEQIDRETGEYRFNIGLLADRLVGATDWILKHPDTQGLALGYFGSSTGAAAALFAAARRPEHVGAVVSRGGRPDLAIAVLPHVHAPTLLIVGGHDHEVIELNQLAFTWLIAEKRMEIVPGATHLFEEPGTLEMAAHLAQQWFVHYLAPTQAAPENPRTAA